MRWVYAVVALALLAAVPAPAAAQVPNELYAFDLTISENNLAIVYPQSVRIEYTLRDLSHDSTGGLVGVETVPFPHKTKISIEPISNNTIGWNAQPIPRQFYTVPGESRSGTILVGVNGLAVEPRFTFDVVATYETPNATIVNKVRVTAHSAGNPGFSAFADLGPPVAPGELGTISIRVSNAGLLPRTFSVEPVDNKCGLTLTSTVIVVPAKGEARATLGVLGPEGKFWYQTETCIVTYGVTPSDNPGHQQSATVLVKIDGFFIDPMWIFWPLVIGLLLVLLIVFLKRRKERLEEGILGKPQKPWTIPVEAVYLKHLKQKDPRAAYVVRNFLMVEEYKSALLWYYAYKKATKGSRKKERLIVRQEKQYEKWKANWKKDIAKPLVLADKYDAKLQRKLDRNTRKIHRKALRKHRKLAAKLQKAHGKRVERETEEWTKAARKAERKGLPIPTKPRMQAPDIPPAPVPGPIKLADHKWAKKAARYRARMERKQSTLEVRFEKADARYLARLQRKMQRLARKLDDPTFVAEHPLLQAGGPKAKPAAEVTPKPAKAEKAPKTGKPAKGKAPA